MKSYSRIALITCVCDNWKFRVTVLGVHAGETQRAAVNRTASHPTVLPQRLRYSHTRSSWGYWHKCTHARSTWWRSSSGLRQCATTPRWNMSWMCRIHLMDGTAPSTVWWSSRCTTNCFKHLFVVWPGAKLTIVFWCIHVSITKDTDSLLLLLLTNHWYFVKISSKRQNILQNTGILNDIIMLDSLPAVS